MESRTVKCEGETNCHMLHYEQVFGNVFERRESKCCAVLMKYCRKVKGEQVITLQMAQQLKTKNINVVPGQLLCCQCQAKFLLETDCCIDDKDKVQSVADTDHEFTECQTPSKKLQSTGISPITLHASMKTLKSNISEAYKVQVDCLKDSESDSYDKNDMKEKVNDLVRLHKEMQEKLASFSEQIQILTLLPDKWSRIYCSEYFNVFEYLV